MPLYAFPVEEMDAYVVDAGGVDLVVANDHSAATLTIGNQFVDLSGADLLELGRFFGSAEVQALLWRISQRQAAAPAEPAEPAKFALTV